MVAIDGHSVKVIEPIEGGDSGSLCFYLGALENILLTDEFKDKSVCVVSVAGAFRKGKSFLLDFFLKYLSAPNKSEWLHDRKSPLTGFSWRGGSDRETTGIHIWSIPYIMKLDSGEEVVVILMDTQGSFDSQSTVKQCATVFALSTLLSSVQIYNLNGNIQEDDLQNLQLFTEYGRLAMEKDDIRDWPYPYEQEFGFNGGKKLLDKRLDVTKNMADENRNLRQYIKTCFEKIDCFLMPHPGKNVSSDPKFDGRLEDIDEFFILEINSFVPAIFSSNNLKIKKIFGQKLTAKTWLEYLKAYVKIYQSDSLPEVNTVLNATAETNNLNASVESKEYYIQLMNEICGPQASYIDPIMLDKAHTENKSKAIKKFRETKKMGSASFCDSFQTKLSESIEALAEDFRLSNKQKHLLSSLKTPAVLMLIILVSYFIGEIFEMFGLESIQKLVLLPFYIGLISIFTWVFLANTGNSPNTLNIINEITTTFFDDIVLPLFYRLTVAPLTEMQR